MSLPRESLRTNGSRKSIAGSRRESSKRGRVGDQKPAVVPKRQREGYCQAMLTQNWTEQLYCLTSRVRRFGDAQSVSGARYPKSLLPGCSARLLNDTISQMELISFKSFWSSPLYIAMTVFQTSMVIQQNRSSSCNVNLSMIR